MEITITGRHQSIDDAAKAYMEEKLSRLSRLFDRVTAVHAILDFEHGAHLVELTASAPPNHKFVSHAEGKDLRKAIDQADHKLEVQVRQWKDKLVDHHP
ncbi:MAG: ribosomal subunit interface protein [Planctomycetes bacterium]|nr:ribosomal subunit interface protein [Planctomycetota bacterium]